MKYISKAEVAAKLKRYIRLNFDSQAEAGRHYGVSRQYISNVLKSGSPNQDILSDLGLERVTVFVKA